MTIQENIEKLKELNGGKVTSPKLKNLHYKLDTPVGSKTDYFLFELVGPREAQAPVWLGFLSGD